VRELANRVASRASTVWTRGVQILSGILLVSLASRWYFWRDLGTLSWDGGNHANGGLLLARALGNLGDNPLGYALTMAEAYPNTWGSLFFYPFGYDLLTMPSYLLFGFNDFAARFPNMFASVLFFLPVYILATRIYDRRVGYVAGFFAVVSPYIVKWGSRALVDVPMAFLLTLAVVFTLRADRSDRWTDWLGIGVALGFAALMKPVGLFLFPILYGYLLLRDRDVLADLKFYASSAASVALAGSYFATGFVLRKLLGAQGEFAYSQVVHWFTSAPAHAESMDPAWTQLAAWTYYPPILLDQLGWPVVILAVVGVFLAIRREDGLGAEEWLLLGIAAYVYLFFTVLPNKDWRYTMPYFAVFFTFAGYAVVDLWETDGLPVNARRAGAGAILLLATAVAGHGIVADQPSPTPPAAGTRTAAADILSGPPSVTIVDEPTNEVSQSATTFYVAANDPDLQYNVTHDGAIDRARWIVTPTETDHDGFALNRAIEADETVYLYHRVQDG